MAVTSILESGFYFERGTKEDLETALEESPVSEQINTAFVERQNGTDRAHNARKARKTYSFSKVLHRLRRPSMDENGPTIESMMVIFLVDVQLLQSSPPAAPTLNG